MHKYINKLEKIKITEIRNSYYDLKKITLL